MEVDRLKTIEYLNLAIDYIEENITESLELEEIAKVALLWSVCQKKSRTWKSRSFVKEYGKMALIID